jgi:hypothetical protein
MTRYVVRPGEWYPVYTLGKGKNHYGDGDFTAEEITRINAAAEEFTAVQKIIAERCGYSSTDWGLVREFPLVPAERTERDL